MIGLASHVLLFVALSVAIVVMASCYADPDDATAFRSMPRRLVVFVASCAGVALVMLLVEYLFAWVD